MFLLWDAQINLCYTEKVNSALKFSADNSKHKLNWDLLSKYEYWIKISKETEDCYWQIVMPKYVEFEFTFQKQQCRYDLLAD